MEGKLVGGRYRLSGELGRGGMGVVWRAHDELLDRPVALKEVVLPPWVTAEDREETFTRVLREARAAARLRHPSVVTVYDVVIEGGHPWIAMELLPAVSLEDRLRSTGPLTEHEAAAMGLQILDALRVAHQAGIMHRDIKPANVMLLEDGGGAVLTDFGIAQIQGDATLTATGMLVGSPGFMAPERIEGVKAGPAADLWALGATLYAAVEGRAPFERQDHMAVLAAVLTRPHEPMRTASLLRPAIEGMLVKDVTRRMSHATAVAELTRVRESKPAVREERREDTRTDAHVATPTDGWVHSEHAPLARRVAMALLGLTAVLAGVLGVWDIVLAYPEPLHTPVSETFLLIFLVTLFFITFLLDEILDPVNAKLEWIYALAAALAATAALANWPMKMAIPDLWRGAYGAACVWFVLVALSTWQRSWLASIALAVAGLGLADIALTGSNPVLRAGVWLLYACWAGAGIVRLLRSRQAVERS